VNAMPLAPVPDRKFYRHDGDLLCDTPIACVTQDLLARRRGGGSNETLKPDELTLFFGGHRYLVCRSISRRAADLLAQALGGVVVD